MKVLSNSLCFIVHLALFVCPISAQVRVLDTSGAVVAGAQCRMIGAEAGAGVEHFGFTGKDGRFNGQVDQDEFDLYFYKVGVGHRRVGRNELFQGNTRGEWNVTLQGGSELRGRLTNGSGEPIAGALLVASAAVKRDVDDRQTDAHFEIRRQPLLKPDGLDCSESMTDAKGRFEFRGLAVGFYDVFEVGERSMVSIRPIEAPSTGNQLLLAHRKLVVNCVDQDDVNIPVPQIDRTREAKWALGMLDIAENNEKPWAPIQERALVPFSLEGLRRPIVENATGDVLLQAERVHRIAVLDPKRGVGFTDITGVPGPGGVPCKIIERPERDPGVLLLSVGLPKTKPEAQAVVVEVWHVPSNVFLGEQRWALNLKPYIELPNGVYRIRVSAMLVEPMAGSFVLGPDRDGFCERSYLGFRNGEGASDWERHLVVEAAPKVLTVHVTSGATQYLTANLEPLSRLDVSLALNANEEGEGLEPRVHLSIRRVGASEWKPLSFIREVNFPSAEAMDWIRVGMTRCADENLPVGAWEIRAQGEHGYEAIKVVELVGGEVSLVAFDRMDGRHSAPN